MVYLKLAYSKRKLESGATPQSLFDRLQGDYAALLESSFGGRYSFIAYDPFALIWIQDGVAHLSQRRDFGVSKKNGSVKIFEQPSLEVLRQFLKPLVFSGKTPVPFVGGLVGFFSYDFGARLMKVQQYVIDDSKLPDLAFCAVDKVICFDHQKNELYLLAVDDTDLKAQRKLKEIENDLQQPPPLQRSGEIGPLTSNLVFDAYVQKITAIHEFLRAGETYQVNFSQRFEADCSREPWQIYQKLSQVNPAPYNCYFQFPGYAIISSSPELLFSKTGYELITKPIKGTVSRGDNLEQDRIRIEKLLASEKDTAELTMIVDLERNDLGKVCEPGSVKVLEHRAIEKYARVIHTVSTIAGKLDYKKDVFDVVEALFPGGSITGCPKKRTMEIIDRLEEFKRGVYCGSAGYIGFNGDAAFNILIRTMLLKNGRLTMSSGGGIVVDSGAQLEYEETLHKVRALKESLE